MFAHSGTTGKGIPASMFMAITRNLFRIIAQQNRAPWEVATQMNAFLTRDNEQSMFVTMFGELPSWGLYLRHIRNITLKNVQLSLAADDFRPAIVEEDVEGKIEF